MGAELSLKCGQLLFVDHCHYPTGVAAEGKEPFGGEAVGDCEALGRTLRLRLRRHSGQFIHLFSEECGFIIIRPLNIVTH